MEKDINKDIVLKLDILSLSPVLKIGITVEYFNLEGKEPNSRNLLEMYVWGELMKGAHHLRTLIEISSYPCEFFVITSKAVTVRSGNGFCIISYHMFSTV